MDGQRGHPGSRAGTGRNRRTPEIEEWGRSGENWVVNCAVIPNC